MNFYPAMQQHTGMPQKQLGLYPGSGVAPGGQQGRMGMVHGGIAARKGGYTPGASGARPHAAVQPAGYDELMKALAAAIRPTGGM